MSDGIYTAPQSELVDSSNDIGSLASRWSRLWASMIDGLIISVITLPVMYFTGGFEGISEGIQPSVGYSLLLGLLGLFVFFVVNGKLLIKNGQTIGKKIVGIKIVDLDGNIPLVKQHLIKRYAVYFIPGQIPVVGQFFSLINILFIFGKQKRCVHDLVAGTRVVIN